MARVIHFEIYADNPERAIIFYTTLFDWSFQKWQGGEQDYWLVKTGEDSEPGINGGLLRRDEPLKGGVEAYVCTIGVPNVDDYMSKITAHGGAMISAKMAIPGMGWFAYAKDTEGNRFGIIQMDKGAK